MRARCKHAGRLKSGRDRLRNCSHPEVGGECETAGRCQTCGKWERAGERTGETADLPPARVALQVLPCLHEGAPAAPPNGQPSAKSYLHCDAGLGVVCRCTCNTRCARYEADAPP